MVLEPIHCPECDGVEVIKHGTTSDGKQRYFCQDSQCHRRTFILQYKYQGYLPKVKHQISNMAMNGSGIRDTAARPLGMRVRRGSLEPLGPNAELRRTSRVLHISPTTVIEELKKARDLKAVEAKLAELEPTQSIVKLCQWQDTEVEADEMWSFVQSKAQQRWLWHAIDHLSGAVLAYVLASHQDEAFVQLKVLLEPFGIMQFYTDGWGADERHLDPSLHSVGKRNTQKIEAFGELSRAAQAFDFTYPH